jgi:surfeit locus 1 family protein
LCAIQVAGCKAKNKTPKYFMNKPLFSIYYFQPSLWSIIAVIVFLPLLISLGYWQLHRAAEKQHLKDDYLTRSHAQPLDFTQKLPTNIDYYPVKITGTFDNAHQFLLDNKFHNHQIGYEVLTPLLLNNKQTVLVNRGWIAQGASRQQLPMLAAVKNPVVLEGIIYIISKKTYALHDPANETTWPRRIQIVNFPQLEKISGYHLLPFLVLLNANQANGFVREWSPINLNVNMHYGYAAQWFALAATLLVLFIILNTKRKI